MRNDFRTSFACIINGVVSVIALVTGGLRGTGAGHAVRNCFRTSFACLVNEEVCVIAGETGGVIVAGLAVFGDATAGDAFCLCVDIESRGAFSAIIWCFFRAVDTVLVGTVGSSAFIMKVLIDGGAF